MNLEIIPHIGIGPVKLGMSREQVKVALGEPNYSGSNKNSDYYFDNSLQVEFFEGKADFIGLSYSDAYIALYQRQNVFDIEASKLFNLVAKNETNKHNYDSSKYVFPEQIVTLWDSDEQYDRIGFEERVVWAQVGLGSKSYLKAVS